MLTLADLTTGNLDAAIDAVDAELAERSLHEFVRQMWGTFDSAPYRDNWHIGVVCEHLQAVTAGEIKRLIVNIPPRCMKSSTVSCAWPAWTWAQRHEDHLAGPGVQFLFASYSHALSIRDSVKCRYIIDSPLYQGRWGDRFHMVDDNNTKIRFANDKHGYRLATSVGGTLTGEGGSVLVVDDPIGATDAESEVKRTAALEWWNSAMSTRLNDQVNGAIVIIMQRLHEDDLTGHVLEQGEWEHLCLPMRYEVDHPHVSVHDVRVEDGELLWPDHIPEPSVKEMETALGSYGAGGQLQQRPAPREGGLFRKSWWGYADAVPAGVKWIRAYDVAGTAGDGNFTVAGLVGYKDGIFYVDDVQREQLSSQDVDKMILANAVEDGIGVEVSLPQDPGQAGKAQVRAWKQMLAGYTVHSSPETGSKETRANPVASQVEAGNVRLVRGDWHRDFIDELAVFPNGRHDDQVDMLSRGFHRHVELRGRKRRMTGRGGVRVYRG